MVATVITISALLLAIFGINMGVGLQSTLLGVRAGIEAFALPMIGIIMTFYFVGYIGGSIYSPRLVNRIGHIRTFAALGSVASAAALLHAVFIEPWTWIILRAVTGFCLAGVVMVAESWLNHAASNSNRGGVLSTYMVVSLGAMAVGQFLLSLAPPSGANLFILVSVLLSIFLVPVMVTRSHPPPIVPTPPMSLKRLFGISHAGIVGCFSTGLINGAFWGMGAVFAQMHGMQPGEISVFMAVVIFGGIITQWPLGKLSDHIDRRVVIIGIAFATVLTSIGLAYSGSVENVPILLLGLLFGMATFPLYAVSIAHVNDQLPADEFVSASGTLLLTYGIGASFGPFLSSTAIGALGPGGLFYYTAVVAFLLGLFSIYRLWMGNTIMPEDKDGFIAVPKTTAVSLDMAAAVISEEQDATAPD